MSTRLAFIRSAPNMPVSKMNAGRSCDESRSAVTTISGDIFRMESFVLKDKPIEQGPFAHCDDDKEVVITHEGKGLSDVKTR